MARKRYKPEEIVSLLRQAEVLHGQGMSMADAIRQLRISEVTWSCVILSIATSLAYPRVYSPMARHACGLLHVNEGRDTHSFPTFMKAHAVSQ